MLELEFWRDSRLRFGQVREDAAIERGLAARHGAVRRAVVIASGGCTALSLLDLVGERLSGVDISPAQVEFVERKARLMRELNLDEFRVALFGESGMQNAGRIDGVLGLLRRLLFATVHSRGFVEDFLTMDCPAAQAERFKTGWDSWRWRAATAVAFIGLALRVGFDREVAAALPDSFAELIRDRVRRVLTQFPLKTNGYAWQTFLGRNAPGDDGLPFFARAAEFERLKAGLDCLRLECGDIEAWLARQPARSLDFFALSNVLELTGPGRAEGLLREVERTAASGAVVCLRAILPGGLRAMPDRIGRLTWDEEATGRAEAGDRGVICNFFRIYRTPVA